MPTTTVLLHRDDIARRVRAMGEALTAELEAERLAMIAGGSPAATQPVVMIPVLTGAMLFVADLIRWMPIPMSIRPVTLSSYHGTATSSPGGVTVPHTLPTDLKGRRVLVLDDIYDSGQTLGLLNRVFAAQHPASLRTAVLLTKSKAKRVEEVAVHHSGFEIDDHFVVGYGLDYNGEYRNLPDVCVLDLGSEPGA